MLLFPVVIVLVLSVRCVHDPPIPHVCSRIVPAALCKVRSGDEKPQFVADTDGCGTADDAQVVVRSHALDAQVSAWASRVRQGHQREDRRAISGPLARVMRGQPRSIQTAINGSSGP